MRIIMGHHRTSSPDDPLLKRSPSALERKPQNSTSPPALGWMRSMKIVIVMLLLMMMMMTMMMIMISMMMMVVGVEEEMFDISFLK